MLSIRLTRKGRRNRPYYRVVVADSRRARDGRFLEVLGHYDPVQKPAIIELNIDKVEEWVSKGANLSDTVRSLIKQVKEREAGAQAKASAKEKKRTKTEAARPKEEGGAKADAAAAKPENEAPSDESSTEPTEDAGQEVKT